MKIKERKATIDTICDNIEQQIEAGMVWTDEGYGPASWVRDITETILSEVRQHIRTAVTTSVDRFQLKEDLKQQVKIRDLNSKVKQLQKNLKYYEALDTMMKTAEKESKV